MNKKSLLFILAILTALIFSACAESEILPANGNSDNSSNLPAISKIKVYYDTQQSSCISWTETFDSGTILSTGNLPLLYAYGYIFQGWYYKDNKVISGQFKVTEDITLTAKWLKIDNTDTTPPAEVTDLKVSINNNKPSLSWVNPTDEDFKTIIITYSTDGSKTSFGGHNSTGAGMADSFTDIKTMINAYLYTFTVQTVDYNGNKSNGVSTRLDGAPVLPEPEPEQKPEISAFGTDSYSAAVSLIIVDLGVKQWEEYFKNKGIVIE